MSVPKLSPGEFKVTSQTLDGVSVLALEGELDLATAWLLTAALERIDGDVVLDLHDLSFLDSHGLHLIFRRAETHHLVLARPQPSIARLLELTDSARILRVEETLEDAVAADAGG